MFATLLCIDFLFPGAKLHVEIACNAVAERNMAGWKTLLFSVQILQYTELPVSMGNLFSIFFFFRFRAASLRENHRKLVAMHYVVFPRHSCLHNVSMKIDL